jgi:hypothetical protein
MTLERIAFLVGVRSRDCRSKPGIVSGNSLFLLKDPVRGCQSPAGTPIPMRREPRGSPGGMGPKVFSRATGHAHSTPREADREKAPSIGVGASILRSGRAHVDIPALFAVNGTRSRREVAGAPGRTGRDTRSATGPRTTARRCSGGTSRLGSLWTRSTHGSP